jgi:hypothetical protein
MSVKFNGNWVITAKLLNRNQIFEQVLGNKNVMEVDGGGGWWEEIDGRCA